MTEESKYENGNGHGAPEPEPMPMAVFFAEPVMDEMKVRIIMKWAPELTDENKINFCSTMIELAAKEAIRLLNIKHQQPVIKAATLGDLPPDLKLPPHLGHRGKGRG